MLSACAPRLVLSTAHLKNNVFNNTLKENITDTRPKNLEPDFYRKLNSIYKKNNSIKSIVDYFTISGGVCNYDTYIICKYKNEERVLLVRITGDQIIGGIRYTWVFKMNNSSSNSGEFEVSVDGETLIP